MVKFKNVEVEHVHEIVFCDDATHQSLVPGDVMVNCADTTLSKAAQARARRRNMVEIFSVENV
jgi:hypothetical protein